MPVYTSGYLTKDGRFFPDRETAKRHETGVDAEEYLSECFNNTVMVEFLHKMIQALLVRYDFEERYDYNKLCREELEVGE